MAAQVATPQTEPPNIEAMRALADDPALDRIARRVRVHAEAATDGLEVGALALSYQRLLHLREQPATEATAAEIQRRSAHLDALGHIVLQLAKWTLGEWNSKMDGLNRNLRLNMEDDACGSLTEIGLKAVQKFDPERCPEIVPYIRTELGRSKFQPGGSEHVMKGQLGDAADRKAVKCAHGLKKEYANRGEHLDCQDLSQLVLDRLAARKRQGMQDSNPLAAPNVIDELVHKRLVKDGLLAAARDLDWVAVFGGEQSLDMGIDAGCEPRASDGTTGDDTGSVMKELLQGLDPTTAAHVMSWSEKSDKDSRGMWAAIGRETGKSWAEARRITTEGIKRIQAPHSMFAGRSPSLESQFVDTPALSADCPSPLAGLALRRERIAQG